VPYHRPVRASRASSYEQQRVAPDQPAPVPVRLLLSAHSSPDRAVRKLRMAYWCCLGYVTLLAVVIGPVGIAGASIQLDVHGKRFSCPDPSIAYVPQLIVWGGRYAEACTTDSDRNALALYRSNDLRLRWRLVGYVFPAGHHPVWASARTGDTSGGLYWAPDIHWIEGRWVVYFAAMPRSPMGPAVRGFVLGVAWSKSLLGPWRSRILHWRGQFDSLGGEQEAYGDVIDPAEAENPQTKQRYLYWAERHSSVWGAELSSDGLSMASDVHQLIWAEEPNDCDSLDPSTCCMEGPVAFFKNVDGQEWTYLLYSTRSTWRGTYEMGAAASTNPLGGFERLGHQPILRSGNGWWGPGGGSAPVWDPATAASWIPYHATRRRENLGDVSSWRLALIGKVTWTPEPLAYTPYTLPTPVINGGVAG